MNKKDRGSIGFVSMLKSILMSFLGVQKESVRERDFQDGRPRDFIIIALFATIVFVLLLIGVVKIIIHMAGA